MFFNPATTNLTPTSFPYHHNSAPPLQQPPIETPSAHNTKLYQDQPQNNQQQPYIDTKAELTPPKSESGDDKPFVCPYPKCKYVSNRRNNMKRHQDTMHEKINNPNVCCGITFVRKADLRNHNIERHPKGVGYRCDWPECDKAFERKALLVRHIKTHTHEKPYKCPYDCNYGTSHKSNLQRHLKVHCKDTFLNMEQDSYKLMQQSHHHQQMYAWSGGSQFGSPDKYGGQVHGDGVYHQRGHDPALHLQEVPSILPDSTTAELSPNSSLHEDQKFLSHHQDQKFLQFLPSPHKFIEDQKFAASRQEPFIPGGHETQKLLPSYIMDQLFADKKSMLPMTDLSVLQSILSGSPIKQKVQDSMEGWLTDSEAKVTHTIEHILGQQ